MKQVKLFISNNIAELEHSINLWINSEEDFYVKIYSASSITMDKNNDYMISIVYKLEPHYCEE